MFAPHIVKAQRHTWPERCARKIKMDAIETRTIGKIAELQSVIDKLQPLIEEKDRKIFYLEETINRLQERLRDLEHSH